MPLPPRDYTIGWICAIVVEYVIACKLLDKEHTGQIRIDPMDDNTYTLGHIAEHNVVVTYTYGTVSTASVAKNMIRSFPNIHHLLAVGIGGGLPNPRNDIRLGDIVVSYPTLGNGGNIMLNFKKSGESGYVIRGHLARPSEQLLSAISKLRTKHTLSGHGISEIITRKLDQNRFLKPHYSNPAKRDTSRAGVDRLYASHYVHHENCNCQKNKDDQWDNGQDALYLVPRRERDTKDDPMIHYGLVVSSGTALKDARVRDDLSKRCDALCFEMEAAGVTDIFPSVLIIRGICDYCDTHKNKLWQGYAAATAAVYAKELLEVLPSKQSESRVKFDDSRSIINFSAGSVPDSGYSSIPRSLNFKKVEPNVESQDPVNLTNPFRPHYIYSISPSIATVLHDAKLEVLVENLMDWILECRSTVHNIDDYSKGMHDLLEEFALRLAYDGATQEYLEDMTFVHKRSAQIVKIINHRLLGEDENASNEENGQDPDQNNEEMALEEKMKKWYEREIDDTPMHAPEEYNEGSGSETQDEFRRRLEHSTAFVWLRERIRRLFRLSKGGVQEKIRQSIIETQPETIYVSRKSRPETLTVHLRLDWSLLTFIQDEAAGIRKRGVKEDEIISLETIGRTITLTGSVTDAQALTCEQYLQQTWPGTGSRMLECLKQAALDLLVVKRIYHDINISGINCFMAEMNTGAFVIEGEIHAVAEVCEILVWLAAALRASSISGELESCIPSFKVYGNYPEVYAKATFPLKPSNVALNGQCWHDMFNNPVVVEGFPILQRVKTHTGLETSFGVISAVLRTRQITILDGRLYLKAFSAMLIPVAEEDDILIWHYIYHKAGDYLWYRQDLVNHLDNINPEMLDQYRHIIGWTSDIKIVAEQFSGNIYKTLYQSRGNNNLIGSPEVCLKVRKSGLKEPPSAAALKGFSMSISRFGVGASLTATVGNKDPSLRVSSAEGIVEKLDWVRKQNIVLWEAKQKRGWLMDGVTVLLYMLRVYLNYWSYGPLKSSLKLKPDDFREPDYNSTRFPDAAMEFFLHEDMKNLDLILFKNRVEHYDEATKGEEPECKAKMKTSYVSVHNRVEKMLEILLNAIELQHKLAEREGVYWKGCLSKHLEGWDFWDVSTEQHHFKPVAKSMNCVSLPWVNFIRSIKAITLFGQGFGEVFEPVQKTCQRWSKLPHGENYLAIPMERLLQIKQSFNGNLKSNPIRITSDYVWRSASSNFTPCRCIGSGLAKHENIQDTVETIHPISIFRDIPNTVQTSLPNKHGAVVFGKNSRFKWYRNEKGDDTQEESDALVTEEVFSDDEFEDAHSELNDSSRSSVVDEGTPVAATDTEPSTLVTANDSTNLSPATDPAASNGSMSNDKKHRPSRLRRSKEGFKSLFGHLKLGNKK